MTGLTCEHWRGVLAMDVFGKGSATDRAGLRAHLEVCQECKEISDELATTHDALAHVDWSALAPTTSASPQLTHAVLGALHSAGQRRRRRRRSAGLAAAVGGLVAASLIVVAVVSIHSAGMPPTVRTEALHGTPSVTASAVLTERSWGTSIEFREHGLTGRGVYTVSMESSSGKWWVAGTYRAAKSRTVDAAMACALPLKSITGVRVTNASGTTILTSYANLDDD
jgi:hypothetical protein